MGIRKTFLFLCPWLLAAQVELTPIYTAGPQQPLYPLLSPATYGVAWDLDMSPYAGGEDLLFLTRLIEKGEVYFLEKTSFSYSKSMYARTWRLAEELLFWLPLNYLAIVIQHEVFGHGYRIRDVGKERARVSGYSLGVPPPYGEGGGLTTYGIGSNLTTTQEAAIAAGGVEATAILAQLTKLKWLEAKYIDPRQSLLYLLAEHDLTLYIDSLRTSDEELDGHDLHGYLIVLNQTYPSHLLKERELIHLSWINFADPFSFYAFYALFHYLSAGKETRIPMIGSCYLPGLRFGLTPFGPEIFFENFFLFKDRPLYGYLKGGRHAGNTYCGIGAFIPKMIHWDRFAFGFRIDLWRQPKLLLMPGATPFMDIDFDKSPSSGNPLYPPSEQHQVRYGGALSAIGEMQIRGRWAFQVELGGKSQGFLPGYSLKTFPTARVSCNGRF